MKQEECDCRLARIWPEWENEDGSLVT